MMSLGDLKINGDTRINSREKYYTNGQTHCVVN